jgi:hypothetical protein
MPNLVMAPIMVVRGRGMCVAVHCAEQCCAVQCGGIYCESRPLPGERVLAIGSLSAVLPDDLPLLIKKQ